MVLRGVCPGAEARPRPRRRAARQGAGGQEAEGGMRVGFHTFGCKLNQYETEALASPLRSQGFSVAGARDEADVYVVNTCTVTSRADHKARALIRALAREHPSRAARRDGLLRAARGRGARARSRRTSSWFPQSEKSVLLDLPRFLEEASGEGGGPRRRHGSGTDRFAFHVGRAAPSTPAPSSRSRTAATAGAPTAGCRWRAAPRPASALDEVLRRARDLEAARQPRDRDHGGQHLRVEVRGARAHRAASCAAAKHGPCPGSGSPRSSPRP